MAESGFAGLEDLQDWKASLHYRTSLLDRSSFLKETYRIRINLTN